MSSSSAHPGPSPSVKVYFRNQFYRFQLPAASLGSVPQFCDAIEENIPEIKTCGSVSFFILGSKGEKTCLTNADELQKAVGQSPVLRLLIQENDVNAKDAKPKDQAPSAKPALQFHCCVCETDLNQPGVPRFQCVSCPGLTLCVDCETGKIDASDVMAKRSGVFAEQSHLAGSHVMLKLQGRLEESGTGPELRFDKFIDQLQATGLLPPLDLKDRDQLGNLADIAHQVMSSFCQQQTPASDGVSNVNVAGNPSQNGAAPCNGMGGLPEMVAQFMSNMSQQPGSGAGNGLGSANCPGMPPLDDILGGLASQFMESAGNTHPYAGGCARAGAARTFNCQETLQHLLEMGFTNEDGWLGRLVEAKRGDLGAVLDVLKGPATNQGASTSSKA